MVIVGNIRKIFDTSKAREKNNKLVNSASISVHIVSQTLVVNVPGVLVI